MVRIEWSVGFSPQQTGSFDATAVGNTLTLPALDDGSYSVGYVAVDGAGNRASPALSPWFDIDTTPSTAPSGATVSRDSDSGSINNDNITNVARPQIRIPRSGASLAFEFRIVKGSETGPWTSRVSGADTVLPAPDFDLNGAYTIEARDRAGNISHADFTYTYLPPLADTPANRLNISHVGSAGNPDTTNASPVPLIIANPSGREYELRNATSQLADFATADRTVNIPGLNEGAFSPADDLIFQDRAGNPMPVTATPATITIDRTSPDAQIVFVLAPGEDTGASPTDHVTNKTDPVMQFTARESALR